MAFDYETLIHVEHNDPEIAIKGRSFNILLLSFLAMLVSILVIMILHSIIDPGSSSGLTTVFNFSFIISMLLICYFLGRKGYVIQAVHIFLFVIIIGITLGMIARGNSNAVILLLPFTIITSGLFLRPHSSFVFAALSMIAYGLAEIYLQSQGTILVQDAETMALNNYMAVIASLLVVAIATWLFTRNIQNYIKTLEKQSKEKEILLKEIHHRVKNNLQIVSSMLNLQQETLKDEESRAVMRDSIGRVKSMALIHERLYMSSDLSSINIQDYVGSLLGQINQSQLERVPRLEIKQDIQEISLDVDISLSLGLIINELVTNSLKHGFLNVNIEEPSIKIILREEGENLILQVSDNGKGISSDINFRDTESLGLQLVNTLADELEGKLTLEKEQGTKFILIFSKEAGK